MDAYFNYNIIYNYNYIIYTLIIWLDLHFFSNLNNWNNEDSQSWKKINSSINFCFNLEMLLTSEVQERFRSELQINHRHNFPSLEIDRCGADGAVLFRWLETLTRKQNGLKDMARIKHVRCISNALTNSFSINSTTFPNLRWCFHILGF